MKKGIIVTDKKGHELLTLCYRIYNSRNQWQTTRKAPNWYYCPKCDQVYQTKGNIRLTLGDDNSK